MTLTEAIILAKQGRSVGWSTIINTTYNEKSFLTSKYLGTELNKVLHDSYVKALTSIRLLNNPDIFSSWLGIIIASIAVNLLKDKKTVDFSKAGAFANETLYEDVLKSEINEEDIELSYEEAKKLTGKLFNTLSTEQKLCVLYHYYEGFTIKEIAKAFRCSEDVVISCLNNGIKASEEAFREIKNSNDKLAEFENSIQMLIFLLKTEYSLCPKKDVPDTLFNSVIEDSAAIVAENSVIAEKEAQERLEEELENEEEEKRRAGFLSGNKKAIAVIAIIIIIVAGLTIHFVNKGKSPSEPVNNSDKPSESDTVSDTKPTMDITEESSTEDTSESSTAESSTNSSSSTSQRTTNSYNTNSSYTQTSRQPVTNSTAPATKPTTPQNNPTKPAAKPTAPQTKPTEPPTQPTTEPTTQAPAEPSVSEPDFEIPDIE